MDTPLGVTLSSALMFLAGIIWGLSILSGFFSIALMGPSFIAIYVMVVAAVLFAGYFVAGYWVLKLKRNGLILALAINLIAIIASVFSNTLIFDVIPVVVSIYLLIKRDLFTQ